MAKYLNPTKSYNKKSFINSTVARPIRMLAEYFDPEQSFKKEGLSDTIAFFGSARITSPEEATETYNTLMASPEDNAEYIEKLRMAKIYLNTSRYYEEARELAHRVTVMSKEFLPNGKKYLICTGGGPGIMEASNRGAYEAGGQSVGLGISLPMEQYLNGYVTPKFAYEFHYFFMRKFWFAYLAKAVVAFPGGFGTLDELFEMLTLFQTKKMTKSPLIILYGKEFWTKLLNFEWLVETGMISPNDIHLCKICDTPEEAAVLIQAHLRKLNLPKI